MSNVGERLQLSRDEFRNITKCLKDEEFRKLFAEYCEELSNPENRRQFEEELKQLEAERGYDIKFVKPLPGYVIKTVAIGEQQKVFVNVSHSDMVIKPTSEASTDQRGQKGQRWSIPYAQTQPRKDYDNKRLECYVYDVIFHYEALNLAKCNLNFRKLLTNTAIDAVENTFGVSLDRANLKFPKLQYKGVPKMSVIRQKAYNYIQDQNNCSTNKQNICETIQMNDVECHGNTYNSAEPTANYIVPSFKLVHRKDIEFHELTEELDAKIDVTLPKELIVTVDLPLLRSSGDCDLHVTNRELQLISESPQKYKLNVKLPYQVLEKNGTAKFNVDEKTLTISLPVVRNRVMMDHANYARHTENTSKEEMKGAITNEKTAEPSIHDKATGITSKEVTRKTIFPKFSANRMDNIFAFTLNVRNVDPSSIVLNKTGDTVSCEFTNIGNGFFTCYYVFLVRFPNGNITDILHEEWDNNLILQVVLDSDKVYCYYAGSNENDLVKYSILENITDKTNQFGGEIEDDSLCIAVSKNPAVRLEQKPSHLSIEIKTKCNSVGVELDEKDKDQKVLEIDNQQSPNLLSRKANSTNVEFSMDPIEKENNQNGKHPEVAQDMKKTKKNSRKRNKKRSLSESCCDQLKVIVENEISKMEPTNDETKQTVRLTEEEDCSGDKAASLAILHRKSRSISESCSSNHRVDDSLATLINLNRKGKGILKRSSFERSISECSSFDENSVLATSGDGCSSVIEFVDNSSSVDLSDSCRKTVRFNDLIKTKLFRSNTSILAQKKKNAKKNESKRRALSRRLSEGESTDNDDKDHVIENNALVSGVQCCPEHDSGISLESELGLMTERNTILDEDDGGSKQLEDGLQNDSSKPIQINRTGVTKTSSEDSIRKAQQDVSKKAKSQPQKEFNNNEHRHNEIEFKSEMIFDIEM